MWKKISLKSVKEMLKYRQGIDNIKRVTTFANVLIQIQHKASKYQIRKVEVMNSVLYIKFMSNDSG